MGDFFIPSVEPQGSIFLPKIIGYVSNDAPIGQVILLGFQHALTMFPATVAMVKAVD